MAQGSGKLGKSKKSVGGKRKKVVKKKQLNKGRKAINPKKLAAKADSETSRVINLKNESIVAAKALNHGTRFFLTDVAKRGKVEASTQLRKRDKKEDKATKLTDRLKDQLRKLGRDV